MTTTAPPLVTIDGVSYGVRWPMRALTTDERASLHQSLAKHGLWLDRLPVVATVGGTRALIDGLNRIVLCRELGIKFTPRDLGELSEAAAAELAYLYNVPGRHLTPAELDRLRSERAVKVNELRGGNLSLRAIAARLNIPYSAAQRATTRNDNGSSDSPESLERNCELPEGVTITPPDPPGERFTVGVDDVRRRIAPAARPTPVSVGKAEVDRLSRAIKEVMDALEAVLSGPGEGRFRKEATRQGMVLTPDGPYCPALLLLRDVVEAVSKSR